jgi:hypothetical protein
MERIAVFYFKLLSKNSAEIEENHEAVLAVLWTTFTLAINQI